MGLGYCTVFALCYFLFVVVLVHSRCVFGAISVFAVDFAVVGVFSRFAAAAGSVVRSCC